MIVVQIGWSRNASFPSPAVVPNIFDAAIWFIVSLFLGLLVIFLVPFRSAEADVRKLMYVGVPFGLQVWALFFGMVRLIMGLSDFLFAKGG
jgi:hypothetical protein